MPSEGPNRSHQHRAKAFVLLIPFGLGAGVAGAESTAGSGAGAANVAYFAEAPQQPPDFIFPMMSGQFLTNANGSQFQLLMYRPLYWIGDRGRVALNRRLSLAAPPRYTSSTRLVVRLKNYRWSNGERVVPQDVVFWMNLLKVNKLYDGLYVPGTIPDNVRSVTARGSSVIFTLTHPVNPSWFTDNQLQLITPLPLAWNLAADGESPTRELCASARYSDVVVRTRANPRTTAVVPVSAAAKSCAAVFRYLSRQSGYDPLTQKATSSAKRTFATSPLWQVVDGPWHLAEFRSDGYVAMEPNPSYSGPVKPTLSRYVELPFTSAPAEFNALAAGKLTVGYLPIEDATAPARSLTEPGPNNPRLRNYRLAPWYQFVIATLALNFNSRANGGYAGRLFRQLYFRQAIQLLVDQQLYIEKIYKNYAFPTYGPVPIYPPNAVASPAERRNPYPYNPRRAIAMLAAHGWRVDPASASTCADATRCGVPRGTKLDFSLAYVAFHPRDHELMEAEAASWQQAGIHVRLHVGSPSSFYSIVSRCSGPRCTWQMANFGGFGYSSPYATGELFFATGSFANGNSYSDPVADRLIRRTQRGHGGMTQYENYIARQLPLIWQPMPAAQLTEIQNGVEGVTPQNPIGLLTPENWRFTR
jgi:peptide/nickel transport system substrate-binding protein